MTTEAPNEQDLLADFSVSDWLKRQLIESHQRDILDALRDTELLLAVLQQRAAQLGVGENHVVA